MDKPQTLFRTSDLYFASFLNALDVPMVTSEKESVGGREKVVFVFRVAEEDLNRCKTLYFGGTGTVKARKFVDAMRNLKSLLHA